MRNRTKGWDMWVVILLGHILPEHQREEWLGDLQEARISLVCNGWPVGVVTLITLLRGCLLLWSLLRIKYQDLALSSNSEPPETETLLPKTEFMHKIAISKANVLLSDSPTMANKSVAHSIHLGGYRYSEPFVALNCGAIPKEILEKRLLGETGWLWHRMGCLELANQGTLFLDEVDELPLDVQAKLQRCLEEQAFTPVGGSAPTELNIRMITATRKDLLAETKEGRFRGDLLYRLAVIKVGKDDIRKAMKPPKRCS